MIDDNEKIVLERIQRDIPLVADPYGIIADECSMTREKVMEILASSKAKGLLRNIAGIFDATRLGFVTALVALKVPNDAVENSARIINSHPGVSHNYLRDHEFNLWFTIAESTPARFDRAVERIAFLSRSSDHLILKSEKTYKIGVMLDLADGPPSWDRNPVADSTGGSVGKGYVPSPEDIEAVRVLQVDLPMTERPFEANLRAGNSFLGESDLLRIGNELKSRGVLRRFAGVLRHHRAGYTSNAMTIWKPGKGGSIDDAAAIMSGERCVSHLYARSIHPGKWEYPLFAMIHAKSDGELASIIDGLSARCGIEDYRVLKSLKEFKKSRVRYFSDEFDKWRGGGVE